MALIDEGNVFIFIFLFISDHVFSTTKRICLYLYRFLNVTFTFFCH